MKSLLFLILFIMFLPVYSQNKWEETFNGDGSAVSIEITDSNNIYIVNGAGIIYFLYKSTNQGKTWKLIVDDKESNYVVTEVPPEHLRNIPNKCIENQRLSPS